MDLNGLLTLFLGFRKKGAVSPLEEDAVFDCIGLLAAAVGPNLTKLLHDQLDLMFRNGLSESLTSALVKVGDNIPPLLKTIQGKYALASFAVIC